MAVIEIKKREFVIKKLEDIDLSITEKEMADMFNFNNVRVHLIDNANWESYPYKPFVNFKIAYTSKYLIVNYDVREDVTKANYTEDNDPVYKDSCVELFISPNSDASYFNIEANAIGTIRISKRDVNGNKEELPTEEIKKIKRFTSLEKKAFDEKSIKSWNITLIIPFEILSVDEPKLGDRMNANLYKCGNDLSKPHYLSWNPIESSETPDFHRPEDFGLLVFN